MPCHTIHHSSEDCRVVSGIRRAKKDVASNLSGGRMRIHVLKFIMVPCKTKGVFRLIVIDELDQLVNAVAP